MERTMAKNITIPETSVPPVVSEDYPLFKFFEGGEVFSSYNALSVLSF